ncbi:MAG: hypothetical protein ABJO01_06660 [Parasphingorhabdus sp.]|uniref:hypothetical protein n=1 Tax=Parasphingorhabdus sp. TaxID=2709688 RepID=UPI00329757F4
MVNMKDLFPYGLETPLLTPEDPDEAWGHLYSIKEYMQDGDPIPNDLAQWLDRAITYAEKNPKEFIKQLGLVRRQGRLNSTYAGVDKMKWGRKVYLLIDDERDRGQLTAALKEVASEFSERSENPVGLDENRLRDWYKNYVTARRC